MAQDKQRATDTVIKDAAAVDETHTPPAGETAPAMTSLSGRSDPLIGTEVAGYLVKGRLGSGGMGIVYEGEQPTIGKRVAIKVLRPEVADNPDVVQRLVAEARAVNQVGHRGIIDVFGFAELPDGRQCIIMEYLDGESLDAVLDVYVRGRRPMPVGDVLIILDEILSALASAHAAGVIHRDLKPSNIFLCRQRDGSRYVKVLDFGIAKLGVLGKSTPATRASLMMGTPSYMAPEQARGGDVGPPMDLYALGIIAFEMFVGRQPFLADSVVGVLWAHQSEVPPAPSSVRLTVPDGVDAIVLKLLEKKPEDRFQTADEVRPLVVKLRKELADPTSERMHLEVTVSEKERAAAQSAAAAKAAQQKTTPPRAGPVMPAREELPSPPQEPSLDRLPRSNRAPFAVLLALLAVVAGGGFVLTRSEAPQPVAEPLPEVAHVEPPEPAKTAAPAPPVAEAEAPATHAEGPVAKAEGPVAKAEGPVAKAERPGPVEVKPKGVARKATPPPAAAPPREPTVDPRRVSLTDRLQKLEARLSVATAGGATVELYLKQVGKIQARASEPGLTDDERDRLESAVSRLEQSSDF